MMMWKDLAASLARVSKFLSTSNCLWGSSQNRKIKQLTAVSCLLDASVFVNVKCSLFFLCCGHAAACKASPQDCLPNEDPGAYKPDRGGNSSAFANEKADMLFGH